MRHIHTTVEYAVPGDYDIHFKQFTGTMGKNFISESDQHFLAYLKQEKAYKLACFLTIEIKDHQPYQELTNLYGKNIKFPAS